MISAETHDFRDVVFRRRVEVVGELVDRVSGEVIASGDEDSMKVLYRTLKRREAEPPSE